ncbi:MAG: polysaccharide pyruvyl transferase family protein [Bacteroidales bacterium]|nr:polysaccharide pyruvyl transferase family protein [Bacteroidales bacterium]
MKTLRILLANAPLKNGNLGCVALSLSALYLLDKLLTENGQEASYCLPDSGWRDGKSHSCSLPGKEITYDTLVWPQEMHLTARLKHMMRVVRGHERSLAEVFRQADMVLDLGQGDSFSDIYGAQRFRQIDRIHRLARKYHKPYCLLPQTIGPFRSEALKEEALKSLRHSQTVMVRDRQSYDYVRRELPDMDRVEEFTDLAFWLPYTRQSFADGHCHVGINISALLWNGGYERNNQFGLKEDYPALMRSIIDAFLDKTDCQVHLVPHVVHGERNIENDYAVCYDLANEYKHPRLTLAPLFLSPVDAKSYISGLDFFVGARMHATIAAFSSGVPVVPTAYSRKFGGLFCDSLQYAYVADLQQQNREQTLDIILQAYSQRDSLKGQIQQTLATTVKDKEVLLTERLRSLLLK